jgi:SNF2 family DNA or RNA helicase
MALTTPYDGFTFHPHQVAAIRWMIGREADGAEHVRGGVLADEMGLGKTWMTIGLLMNAVVPSTLLLVPPMLQPQWSEALTQAGIYHRILSPPSGKGTTASWRPVPGRSEYTVYISTYDRACHNITLLTAPDLHFDRIICDEGHILRNGPRTRRFANLIKIAAVRRWILSGTPVQNRKHDFMNLLNFLGMEIERRLRIDPVAVARTVLLRRTVGDVREVVHAMPALRPEHTTVSVNMPADSEEERVFQSLVGRFQHAVDSHANHLIILELYLRIRQFIAHPAIYVEAMKRKYGELYGRQSWTGTASKMEAFKELIRTGPQTPTIVFGTFKGEMDLAEVELRSAGYSVWSVRGGMTDSKRERVCSESRTAVEEGKAVAIVVQIVAGGAGLNLQHCSRVIFMSSHWNPAVVDQAIARAYRMGQTETVTVHNLLLADDAERNVDRRMISLHEQKRTIAVGIHPKLYCDSAPDAHDILATLDASLPLDAGAGAGAGAGYDTDDDGYGYYEPEAVAEDAEEDPQ